MKKILCGSVLILSLVASDFIHAQTSPATTTLNGSNINTITTAVPFLLIGPDSRAGGMGECGVASSPDVNSMHWNAAKYAFSEKKVALGVSYTPWLRQLVPDINLAYLAGFAKLDRYSTVASTLRYFSLGSITFTDIAGNTIGNYRPNEFAIDLAYSRLLGENFSAAMAVRFIHSNLTSGVTLSNGAATRPGNAVGIDLSAFYHDAKITLSEKKAELNFGLNVSNIGTKITYTNNASAKSKDFIPMNLKLGAGLKIHLDEYNTFAIVGDLNKLLVPTPPQYQTGSSTVIVKGKDPKVPVATAIVQSFYDAPGGSSEELKEIIYQVGIEYWYDKQFAVRTGYFHEDRTKGNRQFFTLGAGVRYNVFGLDLAYLIPTQQRNPLQNTLRFSLTFDFDAFSKQNQEASKE